MADLKPYTREIARWYNSIKFKHMKLVDGWGYEIDGEALEDAKDFLVRSLSGKTQGELNSMLDPEFNELYEQCRIHAWLDEEEEKQKNS